MAAAAAGTGGAPAGTSAEEFRRVYDTLKDELLRDRAFEFNDDAIQWLDGMLDYNVLGGKLNRGLAVVESYKLLKAGSELSEEEVFLACILGWGIEWLQAYFLILDDVMDNSSTRRGKPCWYRLPKVGLIAINDALVLRSQISRIFRRYFFGKKYYVDLLDLFNEVEFQTTSGELLDQITTNEGRKDLNKYTIQLPADCRIQDGVLFVLFAGKKNGLHLIYIHSHGIGLAYCLLMCKKLAIFFLLLRMTTSLQSLELKWSLNPLLPTEFTV